MSAVDERAAAIGGRAADAIAARIEAAARAAFPELIVTRDGAVVTIAGRALARLRRDDPLLAAPAELAR